MAAESVLEFAIALQLGPTALDLQLATRSRTIALVGPSGTGKSTCLRVLAGLERRGVGTVRFGGRTWQDSAARTFVAPWERGVGWVPQDACLFPHASVLENLAWTSPPAAQLAKIAALLEIESLLTRRPRNLSGGERQRVALGRALLSQPQLLLLDEPFAALDRPMRARLATAIREYCAEHDLPLVLVSHDMDDVVSLADERWEFAAGKLRNTEIRT